MKVIVESHHSKGEHFRSAICDEELAKDLSATHCLIGKTTYEIHEHYPDAAICEDAFHTFNWMTDGRDGMAPKEINERAREFESHASMSVGDVVVIHRGATTSIWKCKPYAWELLVSFQTGIAGVPEV